MRILFLSEGNPETRDSWSGISKSVVDHLRSTGLEVVPGDVELHGWDRLVAAATTFSPDRSRWRWRFRLGAIPSALRSRRASAIARESSFDVAIQIGATFRPTFARAVPWFLYCDSNIRMSDAGRSSGQSEAAKLTGREIEGIAAREGALYSAVDGIFTLSERVRRSFLEDFSLEPDRVHTVHGGPNFDHTAFDAPREARSPHHPPTVLFVGRAFERKGGDILLRAFGKVREQFPTARLRIVGPPKPLGTQPGVAWEGFLNGDVPADRRRLVEVYADADVFCLPTRFEPFGIVFLEAMYAGLPCIGTDVWAVPEMIVHGETGWLVPAEDADALAERLLTTLRDTELAGRMGAAGRARALGYFSWSAVVQRMLSVISARVAPPGPSNAS